MKLSEENQRSKWKKRTEKEVVGKAIGSPTVNKDK